MGILEDIKSLLTTEDLVYLDSMPDTTTNCSAIYVVGGLNHNRLLVGTRIENSSIMIKVQDNSYESGYARCRDIMDILENVTNQEINGVWYLRIDQIGNINSLGKNERNQTEFSLNFNAQNTVS